jgi:soluble lytic murein transglycosylase-like protein
MFSPKIQAYINDGGKDAAIQRQQRLETHVEGLKRQIDPEAYKKTGEISFADMLKETKASTFRAESSNPFKPAAEVSSVSGNSANLKTDSKPSRIQLLNLISNLSKKHGVDEKLVQAVVRQESGFNPKATSHCGAMGLMQLMPATAKGLGVTDAYNPVQNLDGGIRHLKGLMAKYNGNIVLALAAYNAGGGNVDKYGGIPPFKETQNYVKSILANYLG